MEIKRNGSQPSGKGPAEWFTGNVRIDPLHQADAPAQVSVASVTFEPGARTAWHSHPLGQTLLVTAGRGRVQNWGKQLAEILPGDVVWTAPGEKHWHGAALTAAMTHISIVEQLDGRGADWMEHVSDEQYKEPTMQNIDQEQEVIGISREKWVWMSERKVDSLDALFHEKAVFVHMGGSWGKEREMEIIKSGGIHYKKADIHEVSVNIMDDTAVLLNRITLLAVVGGNEVTNPFMVTEVYVQQGGSWRLASLSFTRLLAPEQPQ